MQLYFALVLIFTWHYCMALSRVRYSKHMQLLKSPLEREIKYKNFSRRDGYGVWDSGCHRNI